MSAPPEPSGATNKIRSGGGLQNAYFDPCEVWAKEAKDPNEMTLYGPQQIPDNGNPSPNA